MAGKFVAVVGAGAWGTALAGVAARAGRPVRLWAREADVAETINRVHCNERFLPGIPLDPRIEARTDLGRLAGAEAALLVTPAQHVRGAARDLVHAMGEDVPILLCAKGIEQGTLMLMSEVLGEVAPRNPLAVLSGPSFAADVAAGRPTAVTLAASDMALGERLVALIGLPTFRPYLARDVLGAEIGGAVKNVLAIACGIVEGKGFGDSARAALITRGFAEMTRFAVALGARAETLAGLSGLGDLVLTCSSPRSRNMSLGIALGQGQRLADILAAREAVTEGVATAPALAARAARAGVDMPIVAAIDAILSGRVSLDEAIGALLARPFRSET